MTVEEIVRDGLVVFRLSGELDAHEAPALRQRLLVRASAERPRVIVNLGEVGYIDSAGLGVLAATHKACKARGGALVLVAPRPEVRHILTITRMLTHFSVRDTEGDAAALFA